MSLKNNKNTIKSITLGAIIVAVYAICAILSRYLITGVDSMIYYFMPLPLALYGLIHKPKYCVSVFFASSAIVFLFANPIYALALFVPNIFIGLVTGILVSSSNNKILNLAVIFILCFIADVLTIVAYEKVLQVGYFDDVIVFVTKIFNTADQSTIDYLTRIIKICSVIVLMIDSIVKEVMIYMCLKLISARVKLPFKIFDEKNIIPKYSPWLTIFYLLVIIAQALVLQLSLVNQHIYIDIILGICVFIVCILSCYYIYQTAFYLQMKLSKKHSSKALVIIVTILSVILFPISILIAIVLNLTHWSILKAI